jgi:hypothetical protein
MRLSACMCWCEILYVYTGVFQEKPASKFELQKRVILLVSITFVLSVNLNLNNEGSGFV